MSSFITGLIGIIALGAALFCAFGSGIEIERNGKEAAITPLLLCIVLSIITILLLLVRS